MSSSASAAGILAEQSQRGPAVEVDTALIGSEPDPLAEIGARAVEILRRKPDEATAFPSAGIVRRQPDRLAIVGAGAAHFVHIAQRVATIEQRADVVRLGFEFFAVIGDGVGLVALAMIDDATRTVDAGAAARPQPHGFRVVGNGAIVLAEIHRRTGSDKVGDRPAGSESKRLPCG